MVWRLVQPPELGGHGMALSEVRGLTLFQLMLLTRSEGELSGKKTMSLEEYRDWKARRGKDRAKNLPEERQPQEPPLPNAPDPPAPLAPEVGRKRPRRERMKSPTVAPPSLAPPSLAAPSPASSPPSFPTSIRPGREKRGKKLKLVELWNAAMGERDPKQTIDIDVTLQ